MLPEASRISITSGILLVCAEKAFEMKHIEIIKKKKKFFINPPFRIV
jgi:hypothetical protein